MQRNRGGVRTPGEAGIGRAALNPLGEDGDFGGAEGLLGRHREVFVFATDGLEEEAFAGSPGTMTAPVSPPACQPGCESRRRPPFCFLSLWHS